MIIDQKKGLDLFYRLVAILIIFSFSLFIFLSIYYPNMEITLSVYRSLATTSLDDIVRLNSYVLVLAIVTVSLVVLLFKCLYKFMMTTCIIDILFYVEIILFILYLYNLNQIYQFHFTDDSMIIFNSVKSLLLYHTIEDNYLNFYHNNLPLAFIYLAIIKCTNNVTTEYLINSSIMLYVATILLMYHTLKRLVTNKVICMLLSQMLIFSVAVWLHVFNFYTDTLSLFFNMLVIFCLVKLLKTSSYYLKVIWSILLGFACILAIVIKMTLIVLVLAIIICFVLTWKKNKSNLVVLVLTILTMLAIWKVIDHYVTDAYFHQEQKRVPVEHYLAMAVESSYLEESDEDNFLKMAVGSWNYADVKESYDILFVQNRSVDDLKIIKRNLLKKRINKLVEDQQLGRFIIDKLTVSWGTGDLKTTKTLSDLTDHPQIKETMQSQYLYSYMQYWQFVIYLSIIIISISQLLNKKMNLIVLIYQVFLIGCILFFMIWESSPRYMMMIYPMLPICIATILMRKDKI